MDNPQAVAQACEFSTHCQVIEPSYTRLAKRVYILINWTDVRAICPIGRMTKRGTYTDGISRNRKRGQNEF
jgi:hypothetical protein